MKSELLESVGVKNFIFGREYNFRASEMKGKVVSDVGDTLKKMNMNPVQIYSCHQVHGTNVEYCDGKNGEDFYFSKIFENTDGLITDKKGIALVIKVADCTPIVLFDKKKEILAAVHSGWRGTAKRISKSAVIKMKEDFGSDVDDIFAYIGPSIDIKNYEVGCDVYDAFCDFENREKFFQKAGDKYKLSTVDANLEILKECGIKMENIEVSRVSTYDDESLHSYRRDKPDYGLNAIIAMM